MLIYEYFQDSEIACPHCGLLPDIRDVELLYSVRIILDIPLIITSGRRCYVYNTSLKGTSKASAHMPEKDRKQGSIIVTGGCGFDVVAESSRMHRYHENKLIFTATLVGFSGIGLKDNSFTHLDTALRNGKPAMWGYSK